MKEFFFEVFEDFYEQNFKVEFGDILFVFVNVVCFYKIELEEVLVMINDKFWRWFLYIEEIVKGKGIELFNMFFEDMDKLWNEVKEIERRL